jgi:putative endopeptidase
MPRKTLTALIVAAFSGAIGASAHTNQNGLDPRNFDDSTSACVDFFQHADGGWLASNPIPAEYSQWSLDDELRERNLALLRDVLDAAAKNPGETGGITQKIGDFYASALDENASKPPATRRSSPTSNASPR